MVVARDCERRGLKMNHREQEGLGNCLAQSVVVVEARGEGTRQTDRRRRETLVGETGGWRGE